MTAKKYNPGRVEVDPEYPLFIYSVERSEIIATFGGTEGKALCAFAVEAINAAVDKLEKEEAAH